MDVSQLSLRFHGWFNFTIAFISCVIALPIVLRLSHRWRLHDLPGNLKPHAAPTSRLGGIAIGCALISGLSIGGTGLFAQALYVFLALLVVWATGLIDDLRGLTPLTRLSAQLLAGLLVSQTDWRLAVTSHFYLNVALTCLFVMLFINAFNFFDGADGLAAGVVAVAGLGYAMLYSVRAASVGAAVSWSLIGACVGFLLFNFPPAKIFMGDSGSTVLGFLLAFLGLDFYRVHHEIGTRLLLPLIFAGLPLIDLFLAVFRRMRKGVSPFQGDRQHLYDLLQEQGLSPRPIAFGAYLTAGGLVLLGWLCTYVNPAIAILAITFAFGSLFITAVRLGSLR
jgi:UDP-GlcNAc:undecaprenyl-phosphate/decaprenyl-phosphate GlcNAc-1-phosphate transferase